ncbi:50S ribosomal protein L15 [bacterium]|nr:MAG: 50S ribosomal protein L15 [bacterium]
MSQSITLSNIAPKHGSRKRGIRRGLGDGSGLGKTAGRGQKGQTSRSGDGKMVGFEGGQNPLLRRIPKRGFRNTAYRTEFQVVSLDSIARVFKNQAEVSLEALRVHGLVKGRAPVKVLGDGTLDKALKVQAHAFSKSAAEKIQKAGGSAEVVAKAA